MYQWLVYAHIGSVVGFLLAHGASAAIALRLRNETTADGLRALVSLSMLSTRVMYPFLALILLTGVAAGLAGHWWGQAWIWTAVAVFVATWILMVVLGLQYRPLKEGIGQSRARGPIRPAPSADIGQAAASTRPIPITILGIVALAILLWLMVVKPF